MLDFDLLLTGVVMWLAVVAAMRLLQRGGSSRRELLDRLEVPAILAMFVGRAAAVAIDDPSSFGSIRAFLVIRGGVEFWPGVAAFLVVIVFRARRAHRSVPFELAELAPLALVAYGTYEAACVIRDGCYGPASSFGLVPDGLQTRSLPVGVAVGLLVVIGAAVVSRLWWASPTAKVVGAVTLVAGLRLVASYWLPYLGSGPPRTRLESMAVASGGAVVLLALLTRGALARRRRHGELPVSHGAQDRHKGD